MEHGLADDLREERGTDLNPSQVRTAKTKRAERAEREGVVGQRLSETYCWLIVPTQLKSSEPVSYEAFRLRGSDSIAEHASKKLAEQGALVTVYGSNLLRMQLDDIPLWRGNHVLVKQLCEDDAQYLYLPRLKNDRVLLAAIEQGISMLTWNEDGFAYAQDFDADRNRYIGLNGGRHTQVIANHTSLVVKADIAIAQLEAAAATAGSVTTAAGDGVTTTGPSTSSAPGTTGAEQVSPKRFYGSVTLDATRLGRDAGEFPTKCSVIWSACRAPRPRSLLIPMSGFLTEFPTMLCELSRRTAGRCSLTVTNSNERRKRNAILEDTIANWFPFAFPLPSPCLPVCYLNASPLSACGASVGANMFPGSNLF